MAMIQMLIKVFVKVTGKLSHLKREEQANDESVPLSLKVVLEQMREKYRLHPYKEGGLSKPSWMTGDVLSILYDEYATLFEKGEIYYGYIVQANEILFNDKPRVDCPANVIYSTDSYVNENPDILRKFAKKLFSYKEMPLDVVPELLREVVAIIKDERSRQSVDIHLQMDDGHEITITFMTMMVFRKYLPSHKLNGSLIPIMAYPQKCRSVMIVPKKYWSESFIKQYWH